MTYPHTATIKRLTATGGKYTYGTAGTVKCFIQPLDGEKAQLYSIAFTKASQCYLPSTSDVSESDHLVINGVEYGVKGLRDYNFGNLKHKVAVLESM